MAAPGFIVPFSATALAAATAKTVAYVKPATARTLTIVEIGLTFDGTSSSAVPVLVELMSGTAATNSTPGTGSTSVTPDQIRGVASTAGSTAAKTATSEPTVLTQLKPYYVPPTGGLILQFPLGREIDGNPTELAMFAVRCTAPAIVNVSGYIEFEE